MIACPLAAEGRDVTSTRRRETPPENFGLSDRQLEVVQYAWMDVEDIANELGLSVRNTRWHLDQARARLGLFSKRELAMWARERGILRL